MINFEEIIKEHISVIKDLQSIEKEIRQTCDAIINTLNNDGKVIWMGNGGSAADSQHLAAEFVGRFVEERKGLPSIALTTDTSILTAVGNDYGFDDIFRRQIEALCKSDDTVIGISTSGNSKNVLRAIGLANALGAKTVALTGDSGGKVKQEVDICISVPSNITARIQEAHILIGHIICSEVESKWLEEH